MSPWKTGALLCGFLFLAGGVALAFWHALDTPPDFYQEAMRDELPPVERKAAARRFENRTKQLVEDIQHADSWSEEFTQTQINSWLSEELERDYAKYVPKGITQPRVQFTEDVIKVGFHYQSRSFGGIISLKLRPRVEEPSLLAVDVESIRAGLIPLPLDDVIREMTKSKKKPKYRIDWERIEGSDTIVVKLDRGHLEDPILEELQVTEGSVRIAGSRRHSSSNPLPFRTAEHSPAASPLIEAILAAQVLAVSALPQ